MGLDMYLTAKRCVGREDRIRIKLSDAFPAVPGPIREVECEVMYWREANALHRWFVKNAQAGEDNCEEHYVSFDMLKALLKVVKEVLRHPRKGPTLLPTQEGFFFGGTDYGAGYLSVLKETKTVLEEAIAFARTSQGAEWAFYYHASW